MYVKIHHFFNHNVNSLSLDQQPLKSFPQTHARIYIFVYLPRLPCLVKLYQASYRKFHFNPSFEVAIWSRDLRGTSKYAFCWKGRCTHTYAYANTHRHSHAHAHGTHTYIHIFVSVYRCADTYTYARAVYIANSNSGSSGWFRRIG